VISISYWDILSTIRNILTIFFATIGLIYTIVRLLNKLGELFDSVAIFVTKFKVTFYYPIVIRIQRKKHKDYVEEYFNNLLFRKPIEWPLPIGRIKIEWSDEDSVEADLEENLLLVKVKYAGKVEEILAKVAFLTAPYLISVYLEPALGEEFSRLVSIGIVENILQVHPPILVKFKTLIDETYKSTKHRELLSLVYKADDTSLYTHIFLYELRKILGRFGSRVDKDRLVSELEELLRTLANLENISAPVVCGYYINLTVVRAGKLEKVLLELWESYAQYIGNCLKECPSLQRVYIVSAGRFTSEAVKGLLEYLEKKLPKLRLIDKFEYRARSYKGKTNVPHLVAVMEFE